MIQISHWRAIKDSDGKTLCRLDSARLLLEFRHKGKKTIVDLMELVDPNRLNGEGVDSEQEF